MELHSQFAVVAHLFGVKFGLDRQLFRIQREDSIAVVLLSFFTSG
jgi:hypothetical protein